MFRTGAPPVSVMLSDLQAHRDLNMRSKLGPVAAALALCLAVAAPAHAVSPAEAELKSEIDAALKTLEADTDGIVKWEGADRIDIRPHGDGAVAEIANARIAIQAGDAKPARLHLDRLEIRRVRRPDNAVALDFAFPQEAQLRGGDGEQTRLTLTNATAAIVMDAGSSRIRESRAAFAGARLEDKKTGDWVGFGPLSLSSKLAGTPDGGWTGPLAVELQRIEFFVADGPVAGAIERIAYRAEAAGPDFAALNRTRDRLDAVRQQQNASPDARIGALRDMAPGLLPLFSVAKGEFVIERLAARAPTGEPFVALDKASIGGALTGLSGDTAALRITIRQEGLSLAPGILANAKVPRRVVLDFGLEEVETAPLRTILEALKNNQSWPQMLGAAARLNPRFRIYELAVDTADVGVDATAELRGSPLAPKGYAAEGEVAVRGFDALPDLIGAAPLAGFLPLLKEIGAPATAGDGTPRIKFRLASQPPKWLTVNGSDVSPWFMDGGDSGQARVLRPAEPAMTGAEVSAVQRALAAAKIAAPQNGTYDGATALAVARFQKQAGLNVNGVVDAATRQKLGVKPEPAPPPGQQQPRQPGRAN